MRYALEQIDSTIIVRPEGHDLIGPEGVRLQEAIRVALNQSTVKRLVIDFSRVQIVDSSCLAALIGAHREIVKTHGSLYLTALPRGLRHILAVTKLDTIFMIAQTVEDALAFKT